ncbi:ABC transporter permease [Caldiplasma sukawensis]
MIITGLLLTVPLTGINELAGTEPSPDFVYAAILENNSIICQNSNSIPIFAYNESIEPSLSVNFYMLFLNSYDKPIINTTFEMCICEYYSDNEGSYSYSIIVSNETNNHGISVFHFTTLPDYYGKAIFIQNLEMGGKKNFQFLIEKPSYTSNNLTDNDLGNREIKNYTEIFQFQNLGMGMIGYQPLIYSYNKNSSWESYNLSVSSEIKTDNGKSIFKNFTLEGISYNSPYLITSQNEYILMNEAENRFFNSSLGINTTILFDNKEICNNFLTSNYIFPFDQNTNCYSLNLTAFTLTVSNLSPVASGLFILVSVILSIYCFGFFLKSPNTENIIRGPFKRRDIVLGTYLTYLLSGIITFAVGILLSFVIITILNFDTILQVGIIPISYAISFLIYFITLMTVGAISIFFATMSRKGIMYAIMPLILYFIINISLISFVSGYYSPANSTFFPDFININYNSLPKLRDYSIIYGADPFQSQTALFYYIFRTYPLGGFAYNHLSSILYFSPAIIISVSVSLSLLLLFISIKLYDRD